MKKDFGICGNCQKNKATHKKGGYVVKKDGMVLFCGMLDKDLCDYCFKEFVEAK